jgi:hypothetical protein
MKPQLDGSHPTLDVSGRVSRPPEDQAASSDHHRSSHNNLQ